MSMAVLCQFLKAVESFEVDLFPLCRISTRLYVSLRFKKWRSALPIGFPQTPEPELVESLDSSA